MSKLPLRGNSDRPRALLMGTSKYNDINFLPVPAARSDVELIKLFFTRVAGFEPDSIDPRVDRGYDEMRRRVEFYGQNPVGKLFVLYFSGHGKTNGQLYLVCQDSDAKSMGATTVESSLVVETLNRFGASTNQLIVFDCCSAGGIFQELDRRFPRAGRPNRVVFAAAHEAAIARAGSNVSLFTETFVRTFCELAVAANNGKVEVDTWFIRIHAACLRENQRPVRHAGEEPFSITCNVAAAQKFLDDLPRLIAEVDHGGEMVQVPTTIPRGTSATKATMPDWNSRFLLHCTFLLAGYWGLPFLLMYLVEFILLLPNPVDVMPPNETRYLLYVGMSPIQTTASIREWVYDFACWTTDTKKLFTYAALTFWLGLFARILSRFTPDRIRLNPTLDQRRDIAELSRLGYYLPFWLNALLALAFPLLFSPAAASPSMISSADGTTLYRFFMEQGDDGATAFQSIFFFLYRGFNPLVLYFCGLHLLIGWQYLLGALVAPRQKGETGQHQDRVDRRSKLAPDPRLIGFSIAALVFIVLLLALNTASQHIVLGRFGLQYVEGVAMNLLFAVVLFLFTAWLLFFTGRRARHAASEDNWPSDVEAAARESRVRSGREGALGLYGGLFMPLAFPLVPLVMMLLFVDPKVSQTESPAERGTGLRAWLKDPAISKYVSQMKVEGRRSPDRALRFRTGTYLTADADRRDQERAKCLGPCSELEVVKSVVRP